MYTCTSEKEKHDNNDSTNDNEQREPSNENVLVLEKQKESCIEPTLPCSSNEPCTSTNAVLTIEEQSALLLVAVGEVDFTKPEAVSEFIQKHAHIARKTTEAFKVKKIRGRVHRWYI